MAIAALLCRILTAQENSPEAAERTKELQAEQLTTFLDAYTEAIGKLGELPPNKTQVFFLIPSMNSLWKSNKLIPSAFSDVVARMWRVPAASVRKFESTVSKAVQEENISVQSALLWLVQMDRLYSKNDLNQTEFDRFVHRMAVTPIAAVQQWGAATNRVKIEALFQLAGVDDVYPKEQFSVPAFNKALSGAGNK